MRNDWNEGEEESNNKRRSGKGGKDKNEGVGREGKAEMKKEKAGMDK